MSHNIIERLRQYIGKASFSSSSDKYSALECLKEVEAELEITRAALDAKIDICGDAKIGELKAERDALAAKLETMSKMATPSDYVKVERDGWKSCAYQSQAKCDALAARVREMRVVFQVLAKGPKHYQTPDMVASELRVFCGYAQRVGNEFDVSCPTPDTSAQILKRRDAAIWMEAAEVLKQQHTFLTVAGMTSEQLLRAKADELLKGLEKEHG